VSTGEIVVNQHDGRKRECIRVEENYLLLHVVGENAEVIFRQVGDQLALPILHRDGDDDEVRTCYDARTRAALLRRRSAGLALLCRSGSRSWWRRGRLGLLRLGRGRKLRILWPRDRWQRKKQEGDGNE